MRTIITLLIIFHGTYMLFIKDFLEDSINKYSTKYKIEYQMPSASKYLRKDNFKLKNSENN